MSSYLYVVDNLEIPNTVYLELSIICHERNTDPGYADECRLVAKPR